MIRALCTAVMLLLAHSLHAVTFTVTNNADSGPGSLRQALADAGAVAGANVVNFIPALSGATITLASQIDILEKVDDQSAVTVDASALPGGIAIAGGPGNHPLFRLESAKLFVTGITFTGCKGTAISVSWVSNLHCLRCSFLGNSGGVGCMFYCTLKFEECVFSGNGGPTANGGAIYIAIDSYLTLARCSLVGNTASVGGAIYFDDMMPDLTLEDCTLSGNSAVYGGGAIRTEGGSFTRCTFSGNSTGGTGGAISIGGRYSFGTMTHCTISGNTAGTAGGGIRNSHRLDLKQCIVAGNTAPSGADILSTDGATETYGVIYSVGANIVQSIVNTGKAQTVGTFINANPKLAPLTDNGGFTKTMALRPGSPARDASVFSAATSDQRGVPIIGIPDIGAYEDRSIFDYDLWISLALIDAPAAVRAATFDYDGDGETNHEEWVACTDPADITDYLRSPQITIVGADLKVTFRSVPGRKYYVERSPDLAEWTNDEVPVTGSTTTVTLPGLAGFAKFFVRLRVEEP